MPARKTSNRAPWKKAAPKTAKHTKLSPAKKASAKARAKRAGRPYPNLVDNMRAAAPKKRAAAKKKATPKKKAASPKKAAPKRKAAPKKRAASKKTVAKRRATRKTVAKKRSPPKKDRARREDPKGGLTAAGREAFRRSEGAHLKPGVKKRESEMSREEMRRKGSWAARFYGRAKLPALIGDDGEPTRFALTAAAWGEPVPKTVAAARKIAAKGRRLLEKAKVS